MSVLNPFICLIDNAHYEGFGQGTWIGKQTELTRELMVIFPARPCSPISRTLPALSIRKRADTFFCSRVYVVYARNQNRGVSVTTRISMGPHPVFKLIVLCQVSLPITLN